MPEELVAPPAPNGPPTGPTQDDPFGWDVRRRLRWPAVVACVVGAVVLLALIVAPFIHVPYVIVGPGDATPLDQSVLQVHGAPTYRSKGDLLYLTVTVSNRDPNLYRWLFATLDPDTDVSKKETIIGGCASYAESNRVAASAMDQSQETAKAVALQRLGYSVGTDAGPVQIVDVLCDGPARGKLELGEQIVAIDGQPVNTAQDVRPPIVAHRPGETATFTVLRDGARLDVDVRLGRRKDPNTGERVTYAGIVTNQEVRHTIPLNIDIDTARVSGPSAGLSFALAIIDELTPGSLTGGKIIATTGSILEDGSVGIVGGVKQKAITARRAGAKLMLVPMDEVREARAHAGDMKVVGVTTLDDALGALERAGGAPIAAPAATAQ